MESLAILGRQPSIGIAELEALYGDKNIKPICPGVALLSIKSDDINYSRLGGTQKIAKKIGQSNLNGLESNLIRLIKVANLPSGRKINIGISAYGLNFKNIELQAIAFKIKKELRKLGFGSRVVPNTHGLELSTAQVLHNKLTHENGIELILVACNNDIIIARTTHVQDIDNYSARDQSRPKRDSYVGMLPPKLAQIILNLATARLPIDNHRVLDPFCGTGVLLQEALLVGFNIYGTDLSAKMVDFSTKNIVWLKNSWKNINGDIKIQIGDATNFKWVKPFDVVATETFLGEPLKEIPNPIMLNKMIDVVNKLHVDFLLNIGRQVKPGQRLCLAVPAWKQYSGFKHLPCLDQLPSLGYNRVVLKHAKWQELIYHRPEQLVARELVILVKD